MAAHQAPQSLGFSRQEHWSGLPFPSPMHESEKWKWSHSVMSDSSLPHGLQPTRLLHAWDFPGKNTGVGCHRLFQQVLGKPIMTRRLLGEYGIQGANWVFFNRVTCQRTWVQKVPLQHICIPEKPHFLQNHALKVTALMGRKKFSWGKWVKSYATL